MRPIEPEGGDSQFDAAMNIDETFRKLAQAEHAPADFHAKVMAQAAEMPAPSQKGLQLPLWGSFDLRLPHPATVAIASVLLLCMAGLGFLYNRVGQMQAVAEQERVQPHQQTPEVVARQHRRDQPPARLPQGERGEFSKVTLEIHSSKATGEDAIAADNALTGQEQPSDLSVKSLLGRIIETVQWAFGVVWEKVTGVAPTDSKSGPSK